MADQIIITEDEPKPAKPTVVVVTPEPAVKVEPKAEKVITEKTTITETRLG